MYHLANCTTLWAIFIKSILYTTSRAPAECVTLVQIHPDTVWPNDPNVSLARHETRHFLLSRINNPLQEAVIIKNPKNKYSKLDQLPSL